MRGDIQSLRVEISRLADAITNQTAFMQQYVNIESGRTMMEPVEAPTVSMIEPIPVKFPISCDSDLLCLNEYITVDTRDYYVCTYILILNKFFQNTFIFQVNRMKSILSVGALSRSLKGILTAKLIMDYNLEGVNNKKELRCYDNFISALFGKLMIFTKRTFLE